MIGDLKLTVIKASLVRDTELVFEMKPYVKFKVG